MLHDPLDSSTTEALHAFGIQLEAGLGLRRALETSARTCRSRAARKAFESAAADVDEREDFPTLLNRFQKVLGFPERTILAAGWQSGNPAWAIEAVVRRRRLLHEVRRKVRGAMVKPVFVLLLAGLVIPFPRFFLGAISILRYLMEALTPLAVGLGLWMITAVGSTLRQRAWAHRAVNDPPPATVGDRLLCALPVFSMLQKHRNLSEFALLMANLLQAGLGLVDSLRTSACSLPNGVYRKKVAALADRVARSVPLIEAMDRRQWPADWMAMLEVGEQTGEPDKVFARLGEYSAERYVEAVEAAGRWLPRIAYALVALFIVYHIMMMWSSMAQMLREATG